MGPLYKWPENAGNKWASPGRSFQPAVVTDDFGPTMWEAHRLGMVDQTRKNPQQLGA